MSVMAAVSGPADSILDLTPPSGPLPEGDLRQPGRRSRLAQDGPVPASAPRPGPTGSLARPSKRLTLIDRWAGGSKGGA